jgi:antagonist of KipI
VSARVLAPGLLTTVQDGGRNGHAAIGVGSAGAMDTISLRLANLLVGNAQDAAGLEITLRGPRLRFECDMLIAITGADIEATCGGQPVAAWRPMALRAGSELAFGNTMRGARSYVAFCGGLRHRAVLGSRSTDVNGGIGPNVARPLAAGDVLPLDGSADTAPDLWRQVAAGQPIARAAWSLDPQPWLDLDFQQPVHAIGGAHFSALDAASQRAVFGSDFRIGAESNRVGFRLGGTKLTLREPLELISEGVVPGTVQLPPGGDPIILMAEAPTCGGYPRIAQVIAVDLPLIAQRRPGDSLRFAQTSLADAQTRYRERERALALLADDVRRRLRE